MVRYIFLLQVLGIMSFSLLASEFEEIDVSLQRNFDLSQVEASTVRLRLDYAGPISGLCSIVLNASLPIATVLEKFELETQPSTISPNSVTFNLTPYLYVQWIELKVISGESIKNTLNQLGTSLSGTVERCGT